MKFYEKFNGYNRDDLSLTYSEMKSKITCRPFTSALWEVIGFGFLDRKKDGGLERRCNIYGFSNRWRNLEGENEKLDEIEKHLKRIEELKRQPGDAEKRREINRLRAELLKLSTRRKG